MSGRTIDYVSGGLIDDAPDAVRAFDRAWALSLANEAYANVQQSLSAADRGDDDRFYGPITKIDVINYLRKQLA